MARNITPVSKLGGMLFQELPILVRKYADADFILIAVICFINKTLQGFLVRAKTTMDLTLTLRATLLECGVHYNDSIYFQVSGFITARHHELRLNNRRLQRWPIALLRRQATRQGVETIGLCRKWQFVHVLMRAKIQVAQEREASRRQYR
jgi:hypothetical protein